MSEGHEGQGVHRNQGKKNSYRGGKETLGTTTGLTSAILGVGNTDTGFAKRIGSAATTRTGLSGTTSWGVWLATEMG